MILAPLLLAALLSPGSVPPAPFAAPSAALDLEADREALAAHFKQDLEKLAKWCTKKRIFIARTSVFEELIRIDPDHGVARRGLGHTKDKNGVWHPNANRIKPVNWSKKAAAEFPAKRAELKTSYLNEMYALFEKASKDLTKDERAAWEQLLLEHGPDDERIHNMRGETKLGERWVLKETARAKARRAEIKEFVRESIATAPVPSPSQATATEKQLGVDWKSIFESPDARCLGTCDEAEATRLVAATHALRALFNSCFKVEANFPKQLTIYSLANPGEKEKFLAAYPNVDDTYRSFLMKLDGACIRGAWTFAQWAKNRARRVDGIVRLESSWLFADAFSIDAKTGWAIEGFGLYFTRELLGTRLTWFATPSEYALPKEDLALQQRLLDSKANWIKEAHVVLQSEKRPRLSQLLTKNVNKLTTPDLLYSYVLAAFLLESESDSVGPLLKQLGEGVPPKPAFEELLGLSLEELDDRVRRWLSERK